ncbi:hypothetical protein Pres01_29760 [Metapseudomonas resinovorans]|nr:hypothetical protein Pres01_29760 [Pseudomonas resinovorans]
MPTNRIQKIMRIKLVKFFIASLLIASIGARAYWGKAFSVETSHIQDLTAKADAGDS